MGKRRVSLEELTPTITTLHLSKNEFQKASHEIDEYTVNLPTYTTYSKPTLSLAELVPFLDKCSSITSCSDKTIGLRGPNVALVVYRVGQDEFVMF
jgi:hypothetical protein